MKKKYLFYLIIILPLILLSCTSKTDKQIDTMLSEHHEEDMREAIQSFEEFCLTEEKFFEKNDKNQITLSSAFIEKIEFIKDLHKKYHNAEMIPRDEENWGIWMYYKRNPEWKQETMLTRCPFCLAEEEHKIKVDDLDWTKTYLFDCQIDKRVDNILTIMKNNEQKDYLSELYDYIKTEDCFSTKESKDFAFSVTSVNNNEYFVNNTPKYLEIRNKVYGVHWDYHKFDWLNGEPKTVFFYNEEALSNGINARNFYQFIENNKISCCPICLLTYLKLKDGTITYENHSFKLSDYELYYWLNNGYPKKSLDSYAARKDEEKKISSMPLYSFDSMRKEIKKNELNAKEKYNGKRIKVKAQIDSVMQDKVELLYGPNISLPKEDLKKLQSGQYITFVGTMQFYELSTSYSGSSDFENWVRDMDNAYKDLDTIAKIGEAGAMSYSFENCTLLKIEQPKKQTSSWNDVTFF